MKNRTLTVAPQGDREILISRDFDAPRDLVFDAMTRPELLKRWLGVFGGWWLDICEVDLKVGGTYRYKWRGPNGESMGMHGVYHEIVAPERIVNTEVFDEPWYPGEAMGTMMLAEQNGRTTMTITMVYDSREIRDTVLKSPMEQGMAAGYDKLDEILAVDA